MLNSLKKAVGLDDEDDKNKYRINEFTFRISSKTEMSFLKKYACEFWGLEDVEKNLGIYDTNGDLVDPSPTDPDSFRLVEYQIGLLNNKEPRWKDL